MSGSRLGLDGHAADRWPFQPGGANGTRSLRPRRMSWAAYRDEARLTDNAAADSLP